MDLNTKINKTTAVVVPAVLVILYTIAFLVLKTPLPQCIGGHYGSVLFFIGNLYFINVKSDIPGSALPMTWRRYIQHPHYRRPSVSALTFIPYIVLIIGQVMYLHFSSYADL